MSDISDVAVQPMPTPNDLPAVWDLVLADIRSRDEYGAKKYNTRLQPHNGRDYLRDAYDEALDLVVYLRGCIYERDAKVNSDFIAGLEAAEKIAFDRRDECARLRGLSESGAIGEVCHESRALEGNRIAFLIRAAINAARNGG